MGPDMRRSAMMLGMDERALRKPNTLHKAAPHVLDLLMDPCTTPRSPRINVR